MPAAKTELALIFDWETTGLVKHPDADLVKQPKAIEFGGVLIELKKGKIVDETNILINPGEQLEPIITKITGISNEMLADAPTFLQVLPQVQDFFQRAVAMCSHNLPFDKAILRGELARRNIEGFPWPLRELCTVGLYKEHWGRNPKLSELFETLMGKPLAQTHRALDDVKAMVEFIQKEKLWQMM